EVFLRNGDLDVLMLARLRPAMEVEGPATDNTPWRANSIQELRDGGRIPCVPRLEIGLVSARHVLHIAHRALDIRLQGFHGVENETLLVPRLVVAADALDLGPVELRPAGNVPPACRYAFPVHGPVRTDALDHNPVRPELGGERAP